MPNHPQARSSISCSHLGERIDKYVSTIGDDCPQRSQFASKNTHAEYNLVWDGKRTGCLLASARAERSSSPTRRLELNIQLGSSERRGAISCMPKSISSFAQP